jgi:hypothetical protein
VNLLGRNRIHFCAEVAQQENGKFLKILTWKNMVYLLKKKMCARGVTGKKSLTQGKIPDFEFF